MAEAVKSFGYGTSSFAEYAFSGADVSAYCLPTGSGITGSVGNTTITGGATFTVTGSTATFSAGSLTVYPGPESNDTAFGEVAFAEDAFAGI